MIRYKISYHYWDKEERSFVNSEISGKDLNDLWQEYIRIGENHDLAKYGPRSITNLEAIEA